VTRPIPTDLPNVIMVGVQLLQQYTVRVVLWVQIDGHTLWAVTTALRRPTRRCAQTRSTNLWRQFQQSAVKELASNGFTNQGQVLALLHNDLHYLHSTIRPTISLAYTIQLGRHCCKLNLPQFRDLIPAKNSASLLLLKLPNSLVKNTDCTLCFKKLYPFYVRQLCWST